MCWFLCVCFVACYRKHSDVNLLLRTSLWSVSFWRLPSPVDTPLSQFKSWSTGEKVGCLCESVWCHMRSKGGQAVHCCHVQGVKTFCLSPVYWSSLVFWQLSVFSVLKCLHTCVEVLSVLSSHSVLWAHLFVCFIFWTQCYVLVGYNRLFFVIMCHWSYLSPSASGPSTSLAVMAVFSCCCCEFDILSSEVCVWMLVMWLTPVRVDACNATDTSVCVDACNATDTSAYERL